MNSMKRLVKVTKFGMAALLMAALPMIGCESGSACKDCAGGTVCAACAAKKASACPDCKDGKMCAACVAKKEAATKK